MSKSCITCGKGMNKSVRQMIEAYVKQGKGYYYFKESDNGDYFLVEKKEIKDIIKKNKKNKQFNYAHIKEYKGY